MSDLKFNLFRRKSGDRRWVLAYVPPGGTWKKPKQLTAPESITSQALADGWAAEQLAEIRRGGGVLERLKPGEVTLRQCHAELMKVRAAHPDVKPATIKNNWTHLNAQILPEHLRDDNGRIADMPMSVVDPAIARKFVRAVRARVSNSHCRNIFSTMRVLWDIAEAERKIRVPNPWRNALVIAELPAQKNTQAVTEDGEPVALPVTVAQALLDAPDDVIPLARRVRYAIAFTGGFDDGEIAGFTWGSGGERAGVPFIQVRQALAMHGRDGHATMSTPKTDNRNRQVPLHPAAVAALAEWREGWAQLTCRTPTPKDHLFVVAIGGRKVELLIQPFRPKSAALLRADLRELNAIEVRAGRAPLLTESEVELVTFKATRRTFSSMLKNADVSKEDRGKLMGHSGESVTERNYTAHELGRLQELVQRIPLRWPSVRTAVHTDNSSAQTGSGRGPVSSGNPDTSTEPLSRFELETYGLRSGVASVSNSGRSRSYVEKVAADGVTGNGTRASNGLGKRGQFGPRTDNFAGSVRLHLEDGTTASVEVERGDDNAQVADRLASALRRKGASVEASGPALRIRRKAGAQ